MVLAALCYNTSGTYNTATGFEALLQNITGEHNTANGDGALSNSAGNATRPWAQILAPIVTTASNVICIGANALGAM